MAVADVTPAGTRGILGRQARGALLSIAQTAVPLVAALLVGAIVLALTGWDPVSVYRLMAREAFGSSAAIEATLAAATPLLFCGLATAIAFRGESSTSAWTDASCSAVSPEHGSAPASPASQAGC